MFLGTDADEDGGLDLAIMPVGRGRFRALYGDVLVTPPTTTPLYDGGLVALGFSPATVVRVRHTGTIAMSGVLGELAARFIERGA